MIFNSILKLILILAMMISVVSCSVGQIDRRGVDKASDIFYQESLIRRSNEELRKIANDTNNSIYIRIISSCHLKINQDDVFENLYKTHSDEPSYWISRGICKQIEKKHSESIYYYNITLQKEGLNNKLLSIIKNNKGIIALNNYNYSLAKKYFKDSIQKHYTKTATFNLGLIHLHFGHLNKAENIFNRLYQINPLDPDIKLILAITHTFKGNYNKSQSIYSKLEPDRLKRSDVAAYYALNLFHIGEAEKAYQALAHANFTQVRSIRNISDELKNIITLELESQRAENRE